MKNITTKQLKDLWIKFYKEHEHVLIKSASIIPDENATVLFTTAGMQPLVPYLMGKDHPSGKRLVNFQACVRTNDIESVGDSSHLTFFEMLGRWSLGDYFKEDAIKYSFMFLTGKDYLGIDIDKIAISAYEGDSDTPRDTVAYNTWKELGIKEKNIFYLGKDDNWWALGETGPCGPDSEMFYITDTVCERDNCSPACDCGKYLEIGNDVFMMFNKDENGILTELKNKNIDTGFGLERNVAVLNGYKTVYETDAFMPVINYIGTVTDKKYGHSDNTTKAIRVIADHLRTSIMILGDETTTTPSNVGRGYVLRRLLRRALRYSYDLEFNVDAEKVFLSIADIYIDQLGEYYINLLSKREFIKQEIVSEISKFNKTITQGFREIKKIVKDLNSNMLDGAAAFRLYDTYGFPLELTQEYLSDFNITVDKAGYEESYKAHQKLSRQNIGGIFKSGLSGSSEMHTRYHTATHLLQAVLIEMFGSGIKQSGSAISEDRMRFDFTKQESLTPQEVQAVEDRVNFYIAKDLMVERLELSKIEAIKLNAIGLFDDKYGEVVTVYTIGNNISREFCGGPHVEKTGEIGKFKIIKEQSSGSGVRRIRAVLE